MRQVKYNFIFNSSMSLIALSLYGYFLATVAGAAGGAPASKSLCILPPWRTNLVVGENSPRRCPTISSVAKTSIKFLPLCTAKTLPTISGDISEARDQVLIGVLSLMPKAATFFKSFGSINGPFFRLRDIINSG